MAENFNLTIARGEWGGYSEERGLQDKIKGEDGGGFGWGGVEGWGEKTYNCN